MRKKWSNNFILFVAVLFLILLSKSLLAKDYAQNYAIDLSSSVNDRSTNLELKIIDIGSNPKQKLVYNPR